MFILFLAFFKTVNALYECSQNAPPILTINDLTFFQSPNFPQAFIGNTSSSSCDIQIKAENPNYNLWIVILNGAASRIQFFNGSNILTSDFDNYTSNFDVVTESFLLNTVIVKTFHNSTWQNWTAYQASAFPYDPNVLNSSCFLSGKSFDFNSNPDMTIPITLTANNDYINKSCNWEFNVGSLHQLKIVVQEFKILKNSYVALYSDGNLLYNFTKYVSLKNDNDPLTLYFDGTTFNLFFATNNLQNSFHGGDFFILVSAVKSSKEFTSDGCQVPQINGYTTIYTNIDYKNGYPPYQRCENVISFPANYEGNIGVFEYNYEACCDLVSLTFDNNKSIVLDGYREVEIYTPFLKYLTSKANGSVLSFISDGNIQEAGYKVVLTAYECVCGKSNYVIECNDTVRITPLINNENYCDNMDCIYQITSNCPDSYFRLDPWSNGIQDGIRDGIDFLILENNGKFVENITNDNDDQGYKNFLKDNNFTIIFHSGTSKDIVDSDKSWFIDIIPVYPKFIDIMLNETTKNHILWFTDENINEVYTVCTTKEQLNIFVTVAVFGIEFYYMELFDASDLTNYVGNFENALTSTSPELPKSRKSTSGCFTIYYHNTPLRYDNNHTILFKIDEENHCKNDVSVFQIPKTNNTQDYHLSFSSTSSGQCEATVLTYTTNTRYVAGLPYFWILKMNTTATEKIVFKSAKNQKNLLEINPNEMNKWYSFGIYTTAITIILPTNADISISFGDQPVYINYDNSFDGQKGIMASPSYAGYMHNFDILKLYSASTYAELVVKDFFGSPVIVYYSNNQKYTLIPSTNLSLTVDNIWLHYKETDANKNGFLIEYTLYLHDPSTTSTSIIQTTSSTESTKTTTIFNTSSYPPVPASSAASMNSTLNSISDNATYHITPKQCNNHPD